MAEANYWVYERGPVANEIKDLRKLKDLESEIMELDSRSKLLNTQRSSVWIQLKLLSTNSSEAPEAFQEKDSETAILAADGSELPSSS